MFMVPHASIIRRMLNASLLIRVLVISRGYFSFVITTSAGWVGLGWVGIVGYQTSSCFQVMPTSALLSRERASRHLVFEDDVPGCDVSIVLFPSEDVTG